MSDSSSQDDSLAEAISVAKNEVELSKRILLSMEEDKRRLLEKLAGGHLKEMLEDQTMAEAQLESPNPSLRSAALIIFADHWRNTAKMPQLCERIALGDHDPEVSILALSILCEYFEGSKDFRIGRLLAGVVCDESRPADYRAAAYNGLFQISGVAISSWPNMKRFLGSWRFPNDVDWDFVQRFLSQS